MNKKKKDAEIFIKDVYGENAFDGIKKESDIHTKEIAEVIVKGTLVEKKPKSLRQFDIDVDRNLKEAGIVDAAMKQEIFTKIQKTKMFRALMENSVPDEDLIPVFKDALKAEKVVVVDRMPIPYTDHNTRMAAAESILKFKGVDTKGDESSEAVNNFQINVLNPNDFK